MELNNPLLLAAIFDNKSKSAGGLNVPDLLKIANYYKVKLSSNKPSRAELVTQLRNLVTNSGSGAGAGAGAGAGIGKSTEKSKSLKVSKPKILNTVSSCMDHFKELDEVITLLVAHGKKQYGENYVEIAGLVKRMLLDKKPGQISLYKSSKAQIKRCIATVEKSRSNKKVKLEMLGFLEKLGNFIKSIVEDTDNGGGSSILDMIMPNAPTDTILMLPDAPTTEINIAKANSRAKKVAIEAR